MPKYILCTKTSDGNFHYRSFDELYDAICVQCEVSEYFDVEDTSIYSPVSKKELQQEIFDC